MVQSYTKTPRFGDPKKFQEELDATILKVQKLESELYAKNKKLSDIENKLGEALGKGSPLGSRSTSTGYGTMSNTSCSDEDCESLKISGHMNEFSIHDYVKTAEALYAYDGDCDESSIPMMIGEKFIIINGDDHGWSRVRRKLPSEQKCEGFVPTSYLQLL